MAREASGSRLRAEHKSDPRLDEFLGVNYDCCHFAVEFEEPQKALNAFKKAGIKISKIHLSSALKTLATSEARAALKKFADDVYLHQVIARGARGKLEYFRDLPDALATNLKLKPNSKLPEWRIHFHVPLHAAAIPPFQSTNDHLLGTLDWLAKNPVDAFGRPFFSKLGRTRLFDDADISRIKEANRVAPCPSKSSRPAPVKRRTIRSEAHISGSLWTEAQELLRKPLRSDSSRSSKQPSNVVNIQRSQKSRTLQPS